MDWLNHLSKEQKDFIQQYNGTKHFDELASLLPSLFLYVTNKSAKALSPPKDHAAIDTATNYQRGRNLENEFAHLRSHAENHASSALTDIDNKLGANGQYALAVIDKHIRELKTKIQRSFN